MAAKLAIYFSNQAHSPHKLRGREWGLRVMRLHPWHTTLTLMGATRPASVKEVSEPEHFKSTKSNLCSSTDKPQTFFPPGLRSTNPLHRAAQPP